MNDITYKVVGGTNIFAHRDESDSNHSERGEGCVSHAEFFAKVTE
jgi:hypothetical protein